VFDELRLFWSKNLADVEADVSIHLSHEVVPLVLAKSTASLNSPAAT